MNNFAKGMVVGSMVGAAFGIWGADKEVWMKKNVLKPGRKAIKKASRVMNNVAGMI